MDTLISTLCVNGIEGYVKRASNQRQGHVFDTYNLVKEITKINESEIHAIKENHYRRLKTIHLACQDLEKDFTDRDMIVISRMFCLLGAITQEDEFDWGIIGYLINKEKLYGGEEARTEFLSTTMQVILQRMQQSEFIEDWLIKEVLKVDYAINELKGYFSPIWWRSKAEA